MSIEFQKFVGAGNDFIFVNDSFFVSSEDRVRGAKDLCDRTWGIGADGLVIMTPLDQDSGRFRWDFYNNDGSRAEMCGNAARCAVAYCYENFGCQEIKLETAMGLVHGVYSKEKMDVSWVVPKGLLRQKQIDLESKTIEGFFIDTGVPHFVILNQEKVLSREDCKLIQEHPSFAPQQTNVTLLDVDDKGTNKTKSFERGVKNFTLACGTGVIACAFVLENQKVLDSYTLQTPGGTLHVKIDGQKINLIGPAHKTFQGTLKERNL